jgi:hypothetical protein
LEASAHKLAFFQVSAADSNVSRIGSSLRLFFISVWRQQADDDSLIFALPSPVLTVVSEHGLFRGGFLEVFLGRDQVSWPLVGVGIRGAARRSLEFQFAPFVAVLALHQLRHLVDFGC